MLILYAAGTPAQISTTNAFPELSFSAPVELMHAGDGSNLLFVIEQTGTIAVFENDPNTAEKQTFLDISEQVLYGGEQGLLGLAFHPDYENNGLFFVYYSRSGPRRSVISRFSVDAGNPMRADAASEHVILEVEQPYSNHNAGQLQFGPDGYLYIALGDGGSGGDPQGNGQNRETLLGSILRIDVDDVPAGQAYGIPAENPFAGNSSGWREEIFAYGLRNPWRFSFDSETGWLWTADVGQNKWEEVHVIENGGNYGWNIMEGFHCYLPATGCDQEGLMLPIWEYGHDADGGFSVTGGFVYRGERIPELYGKYIYADFVSGHIWALEYDGAGEPQNERIIERSGLSIAGFGVDAENELYLCSLDGEIHKFETPTSVKRETAVPSGFALSPPYPNPFNPEVTLRFELPETADVVIDVYDAAGAHIEQVVSGDYAGGVYSVSWDAGARASGVYYARMSAVNAADGEWFTASRKLLLLK